MRTINNKERCAGYLLSSYVFYLYDEEVESENALAFAMLYSYRIWKSWKPEQVPVA